MSLDSAGASGRPPNAAQFRTTHWSVVLQVGQESGSEAALETLCRSYWYPVYAFIRRQGHAPHDAQDLTQGFFAHVLDRNTFAAARPEKGRFRSFLLGALKRFLAYETRKQTTLKRGGAAQLVPVDEEQGEERYRTELAHELTPEKLFLRSWSDALLSRAFQALREDYEKAGKQQLFEALKAHLSNPGDIPSHKELGHSLGLSPGAISTSLYRMRRRYADILRLEIAQTVGSQEEVDDEISFLFSTMSD